MPISGARALRSIDVTSVRPGVTVRARRASVESLERKLCHARTFCLTRFDPRW